jgi:hypothetical protein
VKSKHVLFVTRDRNFRGNLTISATQFAFKWNPRAKPRAWAKPPFLSGNESVA